MLGTFLATLFTVASLVSAQEPTTFFTGTLMPTVYPRLDGFAKGNPIKVYLFDNALTGTVASGVTVAPIYVFRKDANASSAPLQMNLVDVAPGDAGYSDLWNVTVVTVTGTMTTNVTSMDQLNAMVASGAAKLSYPNVLVNCPVANPNSTLQVPSDAKSTVGYYKGMKIFYFDFGVNGAGTGNALVEPVYIPQDA
ncbi:hypothetical protein HDU98_001942, partial [Podochytrium sp. JEL0797]